MREFGAQVHVHQSFQMLHGIGLWLVERRQYDGIPVSTVGQPAELVYADLPEHTAPSPTLLLSDDMGRALLDALSAHYGGHSDVRSLRKDYDAERKRVDKLTDAVIQAMVPR